MVKKYIVQLSADEQQAIAALTHNPTPHAAGVHAALRAAAQGKGKVAARKLTRANILRLAHEKFTDEEIAAMVDTSIATIERVREKFVVGGLEWALSEEPRCGTPRKLDGKQEAFLVALACSTPPAGHECWTMQLLAEKLLELKIIEDAIADDTVRRALKKTNSSRG